MVTLGNENGCTGLEGEALKDLLSVECDLQDISGLVLVLLEEDVPSVVKVELDLSTLNDGLVLDPAELPVLLGLVDCDEGELSLGGEEHAVAEVESGNGDDIHQTDGCLGAPDGLSVDEDVALTDDSLCFPCGVTDLEQVPDHNDRGHGALDRV